MAHKNTECRGKTEKRSLDQVYGELGIAVNAPKQRKVLQERNITNDLPGWQTTKRTMGILSMMSMQLIVNQASDDSALDNGDGLVRQGRRTYSKHCEKGAFHISRDS